MSARGPQKRLPAWADEWMSGQCGCGGRLVRVACQMGHYHTACAASGWGIDKCPNAPAPDAADPEGSQR